MSNRGQPRQSWAPLFLSVLISFMLSAMALPSAIALLRPEWVAMTVLFWAVYKPQQMGITLAWVIGLMLDVMSGSLLGVQAFTIAVVAYIGLTVSQRLKLFPFIHQSAAVFIVIGLQLLISHWIQGLFASVSPGLSYLIPAATSALIWTFYALMLTGIDRSLR